MRDLPSNTALMVIDAQTGFDDGSWGTRNNPEAEANIARLLQAWRATGRPVAHIHHDNACATGSFRPGSAGHATKPEAAPWAGEPVLHKTAHSAFIGTRLETDLRGSGIAGVVIVGFTTNHCVSTTARMAGDLGFETFIVADATASFDGAGFDGRRRTAAEIHFAALSDLHGEFAEIVDTGAVLDAVLGAPRGRMAAAAAQTNARAWTGLGQGASPASSERTCSDALAQPNGDKAP